MHRVEETNIYSKNSQIFSTLYFWRVCFSALTHNWPFCFRTLFSVFLRWIFRSNERQGNSCTVLIFIPHSSVFTFTHARPENSFRINRLIRPNRIYRFAFTNFFFEAVPRTSTSTRVRVSWTFEPAVRWHVDFTCFCCFSAAESLPRWLGVVAFVPSSSLWRSCGSDVMT